MTSGDQSRQDAASSPPGEAGEASGQRQYRVFLSYSHADVRRARWLLRRLEGFRIPERLRGRVAPIGRVGPRVTPVFRDRDELPTAADLGETIRAALRQSATLVVICSPAAAKSRWVDREILEFKRLHGESGVVALVGALTALTKSFVRNNNPTKPPSPWPLQLPASP